MADKLVGNQEMLGKRIIFTIPDFFFRLFVGVVIFIQFVESRYRHRPGFFWSESLALQIINLDSINQQVSTMVCVRAICIAPEFCISGPLL